MLGSDNVRAIAQAASATLLLTGSAAVWELAVLQAVYGFAAAFFGPAVVGNAVRLGRARAAAFACAGGAVDPRLCAVTPERRPNGNAIGGKGRTFDCWASVLWSAGS
jgi:hypothetical protein